MTPEDAEEKAMSEQAEKVRRILDASGLGPWTTDEVVVLVGSLLEGVAQGITAQMAAETRDVGEHDWDDDEDEVCRRCTKHYDDANLWCPSVQERRLVGPWEPVSDEGATDE